MERSEEVENKGHSRGCIFFAASKEKTTALVALRQASEVFKPTWLNKTEIIVFLATAIVAFPCCQAAGRNRPLGCQDKAAAESAEQDRASCYRRLMPSVDSASFW